MATAVVVGGGRVGQALLSMADSRLHPQRRPRRRARCHPQIPMARSGLLPERHAGPVAGEQGPRRRQPEPGARLLRRLQARRAPRRRHHRGPHRRLRQLGTRRRRPAPERRPHLQGA